LGFQGSGANRIQQEIKIGRIQKNRTDAKNRTDVKKRIRFFVCSCEPGFKNEMASRSRASKNVNKHVRWAPIINHKCRMLYSVSKINIYVKT
jgi:hypothetical protein